MIALSPITNNSKMINIKEQKKYKWYFILISFVLSWMIYAETTGWNVFSSDSSEKWSAAGHQNYHK